ncbi:MAG: hypothetical protein HQ478_13640 [Chloroflexi bacterium]|nr:hypothetical protein [Chloroflexota bacterium]
MNSRADESSSSVGDAFNRRLKNLTAESASSSGIWVLLGVLFLVAVYRWAQFTNFAAPPGSDGGQWLAFGHQMLTGDDIKAGLDQYPPIIPFGVGVLARIVGAMLSLKLIGFASSLLVAVPLYFLFRRILPWRLAVGLAVLPTLSPYHAEVLSFGGYPQLAGTGFLLMTLVALGQGIEQRNSRWLLAAGLLTGLTVATHAMAVVGLAIAVPVVVILAQWRIYGASGGRQRINLTPLLWWVVPGVLLALPMVFVYSSYFLESGQAPSGTPGLTYGQLFDFFDTGWRWESIFWLAASIVSIGVFVSRIKIRGAVFEVAVALSLLAIVGILGLLELRFLELMEVALVLWLGIASSWAYKRWSSNQSGLRTLALFGAFLAVLLMLALGHRRTLIAGDWYRVLDHQVVGGLDWLRVNGDANGRAVSSRAIRGHNFGWWIEGYTHIQAYSATEEFLIFEEEQRQGRQANRLIDSAVTRAEVESIVAQENIQYIFLDNQIVPEPPAGLIEAGFSIAYENDRVTVLGRMGASAP